MVWMKDTYGSRAQKVSPTRRFADIRHKDRRCPSSLVVGILFLFRYVVASTIAKGRRVSSSGSEDLRETTGSGGHVADRHGNTIRIVWQHV